MSMGIELLRVCDILLSLQLLADGLCILDNLPVGTRWPLRLVLLLTLLSCGRLFYIRYPMPYAADWWLEGGKALLVIYLHRHPRRLRRR